MGIKYLYINTVDEACKLFSGGTVSPPEPAPPCPFCRKPAILNIAEADNPNGNVGRPYYMCPDSQLSRYVGPKCPGVYRFFLFADDRGNDSENEKCSCQVPSKRCLAGRWEEAHKIALFGQVFYTCKDGRCNYYNLGTNDDGEFIVINDPDLIAELATLKII
ncbi:hypothetical protein F5Y11DRAFT_344887 [Daldinia sp. FL1419]|nr:hypothetical protein F5Y11DRAFT_344887 [Daldinia sp. FL1419]